MSLETALARVVTANVGKFRGMVEVETLSETAWASVTFCGARHRLRLSLGGEGAVGAAADLLDVLPEIDLPLPGRIVADIAILSEQRSDAGDYASLELEALSVEDN